MEAAMMALDPETLAIVHALALPLDPQHRPQFLRDVAQELEPAWKARSGPD
jgi:hypothetical protein